MKTVITFCLCLILSLSASAQDCFPDGIKFRNQSDVDNFIINNPTCKEIIGTLEVSENSTITNLEGLKNIEVIKGDFIVWTSLILQNFQGMNNLKSVEGTFRVQHCDNLKSFVGLNNLQTVYNFSFTNNNNLLDSCGLLK